ncbi:MAG: hypothetical protein R3C14_32460 [Caldilineaceae bacterium]
MVTKSIRLSPEESEEIRCLSEQSAISEAALMKQWVLNGVQEHKLENAIRTYLQGKTDLRGGAAIANLSYNRFLHEIQSRNIVVLDGDSFLEELAFLADAFHDEILGKVVDQMQVEKAQTFPVMSLV